MAHVRRSGRISRQVPIILLGTDTAGRVFSEETHTLVLSLHGAGIRSRNKFAPDEVLTMRLADSGRETDIRLVGRLGRGNVFGITFCDPNLDFWQIEFPPRRSLSRVSPASISNVVFATNGSTLSKPKSNRTFFSLAKLSSVSVSPADKPPPGKRPLERLLLRASDLHQFQPLLRKSAHLLNRSRPQCRLRPPLQYPPTPALPSLATSWFPPALYCWLP